MRRHLDGRRLLDVAGKDDGGDAASRLRDSQRTIHQVAHLIRRHADLDEVPGHILEERRQIDLLLVVTADRATHRLTNDGEDRLVVQLGVIESVEQVNGPGSRGGEAHTHLAGDPGMAAGHEGGLLLMPDLNELEAVAGPAQRGNDPADPVAGIAEDAPDAPLRQPVQQEIADLPRHELPPVCMCPSCAMNRLPVAMFQGIGRALRR